MSSELKANSGELKGTLAEGLTEGLRLIMNMKAMTVFRKSCDELKGDFQDWYV